MKRKGMPIEFCGNCGIGQKTHESDPGYCNYHSPGGKNSDRRCTSWTPAHWLHNERVVFICSPLKGRKLGPIHEIMAENLRQATLFCRAAVASHATPVCPHLYFSHFLDDMKPGERNLGREMAMELLKRCDELWVFGEPSEGMEAEIEAAEAMRLPIVYIPKSAIKNILKEDEENGGH